MKNQRCILTLLAAGALFHPVAQAARFTFQLQAGLLAHSLQIQAADLQDQRATLTVQDFTGQTWYAEEVLGQPRYAKMLNLAAWPIGHYCCAIESPEGRRVQTFRLDFGGIVTVYQSAAPMAPGAPFRFAADGAPNCLVRLCGGSEQDATVLSIQLANLEARRCRLELIRLDDGQVILDREVEGEIGYARNFKLAGLPKGHYCLRLVLGQSFLVQQVEVNEMGLTLGGLEQLSMVAGLPALLVKR